MQAPQRERVSLSTRPRQRSSRGNSPDGQQPNSWGNAGKAAKAATWRERIRPDVNMGVPTLLMLLEPNVVWQHAAASHVSSSHGWRNGCSFQAQVLCFRSRRGAVHTHTLYIDSSGAAEQHPPMMFVLWTVQQWKPHLHSSNSSRQS